MVSTNVFVEHHQNITCPLTSTEKGGGESPVETSVLQRRA